jgi:murein DD-endopeptidase MepM/ murein hydrolase activator NlpD
VRVVLAALLPLLLVACTTPRPPAKAPAGRPAASSRPPIARPPAPAAPAWRAVPARADGAVVPGGRRHSVKRGETGIAIARAYGVSWSRIASANSLDRDAVLEIGQKLFIPLETARAAPAPRGAPKRPASPEEQAAAFKLDVDDVITGSAVARAPQPKARPAPPPPAPVAMPVPKLAWPVDGRVILSRFGVKPGGRVNDGINIKALRGSAVRAAADGEVIYVGDAIASFGLMMLVRHPGGAVTAYGHLEDALAARGDRVQRGQPIARAGASGDAREPQLMFQLRQGRKPLDPLLYLP